MKSNIDLDKIPKWKSRRKFSYIRPKKKEILQNEMPNFTLLKVKRMRGFMVLLSDINVDTELLKEYNFEWYEWLFSWYNPKTKHKRVKSFEQIPFYHKHLEQDFKGIYEAIFFREKFLKNSFIELGTKFKFKTKTYSELFENKLSLEALEKINERGAFYYKLPKKYKFFEMTIEGKQVKCNEKINIPKTKLVKLSKHLVYFGIIDTSKRNTKKPYFLNYFSKEELQKKSTFKGVERMSFLKHSLKERDILGYTLEGNLIWDIDDIPKDDLKYDILVLDSKGSLFNEYQSFILKGES